LGWQWYTTAQLFIAWAGVSNFLPGLALYWNLPELLWLQAWATILNLIVTILKVDQARQVSWLHKCDNKKYYYTIGPSWVSKGLNTPELHGHLVDRNTTISNFGSPCQKRRAQGGFSPALKHASRSDFRSQLIGQSESHGPETREVRCSFLWDRADS
jgi:hypothetical protein